jgi:4-amino-4-deoxy-L-arabinose transferase-like glycosyltransferase
VLPTFALVYLLGSGLAVRTRLVQLIAAFVLMAVVSASWGLVVDLTPPDNRPYVGSSPDNSVFGLTFGYNGLDRMLGLFGKESASPIADYIPTDRRPGMPGFGGPPGPFRLAGPELAGQITWLFPLAVVGSMAAAARVRRCRPLHPDHLALLLWGGWLGSYAVVFSLSRGIIHPYYLAVLGPALAALVGIGGDALLQASRTRTWAIAAGLLLTAVWEARVLGDHTLWRSRLLPALAGGVFLSVCGLIADRLIFARWPRSVSLWRMSAGLGLAAVFLGPASWSLMPVVAEGNPMIPVADPALLTGVGGLAPTFVDAADARPLLQYLQSHRRGERYMLVTSHLMLAALFIVETGEPVIVSGGFMGSDPVLTADKFAQLVSRGEVRFALLSPIPSGSGFGRPENTTSGVRSGGIRAVDPALWRPAVEEKKSNEQSRSGPADATVPLSGRLAREKGQVSVVRLSLRTMELYDFNPNTDIGTGVHHPVK